MKAIGQMILVTSLCVSGWVFGASEPQPELSIVLEPGRVVDGVPQAFTFVLTNTGERDLRLPKPYIDCSNPTPMGSIVLEESWQPPAGTGLGKGEGVCDFGGSGLPPTPVLERARSWKQLRVGESISIRAEGNSLHYETSGGGTYTFAALYLPPVLSEEERRELTEAGIVVPQKKALSGSLEYRR